VAALGLHDNFGFFMLIRVSPIVPTRIHSLGKNKQENNGSAARTGSIIIVELML